MKNNFKVGDVLEVIDNGGHQSISNGELLKCTKDTYMDGYDEMVAVRTRSDSNTGFYTYRFRKYEPRNKGLPKKKEEKKELYIVIRDDCNNVEGSTATNLTDAKYRADPNVGATMTIYKLVPVMIVSKSINYKEIKETKKKGKK